MKQPKPFYIVVNPVGSKFAKAIQTAVKARTTQRVLRVSTPRINRLNFKVTPNVKDKIQQFRAFTSAQVSCPKYCTNVEGVGSLGKTVFARQLINSTNGRGIVEFEPGTGTPIPPAPLYTQYIPKKSEYRVHVFNGEVIDLQQKLKKKGGEANTRVRNLHNGYIYARSDIAPPGGVDRIGELAVRAVRALDYQYGAVDIIYNEKQDQYYVLEVNSRPGLMGTTVERYADALVKMYKLP